MKVLEARQIEARSRACDRRARVYEVERGQCYYAHSQSEPGLIHHQTRERDGWRCECRGYGYTGSCYHLGQVQRRAAREGWSFGAVARNEAATAFMAPGIALLTGKPAITQDEQRAADVGITLEEEVA